MWWALTTLFDKDLLYRGHKILPYCPRCGTALSSHEVAQGYEDVEDPSVYVALDLGRATDGDAASAHSRVDHDAVDARVEHGARGASGPRVRRARAKTEQARTRDQRTHHPRRSARCAPCSARTTTIAGRSSADCAAPSSSAQRYRAPARLARVSRRDEHEIIVGEEFVSADDGTGVVHMAPAFGADDYAAGQRHNLAFLQPVDARGEFPASMPLVGGMFVKDADRAADRGAEAARRAVEGRHA